MSPYNQQTPACLMTIFGATGDLTKRLLLPSIYNLVALKVLPDEFRLLGVAAEAWDADRFRSHIAASLKNFWGNDADESIIMWLTSRADYLQGNFEDTTTFDTLNERITQMEQKSPTGGNRLFYLAVAPAFIAGISEQLSRVRLLKEDGSWRRLVIEKPFGHDLASAVSLNADLQKNMREDQIYRIDHFAGKETVQDLAVFRFSNAIIESIWNRSLIANVQITAAETVGVEGRASYYEKAGALRDMVPNHMAELLSLVAMEPPVSFSAEHMRDKQVELLESTRKLNSDEVSQNAVRGQYDDGTVANVVVPAYRKEPNVALHSNTETYVAMKVEIDNWRWSGVPFYLRTGKRLSNVLTEIVITFRQPPIRLFPSANDQDQPSQLIFNMQPAQGIQLSFGAKASGLITTVYQERMKFDFPAGPFGNHGKGYERLLHDVMIGDTTLFQRSEFVEEGWKLVQPLLDSWQAPPTDPLPNYAAGSAGPKSADDLLAKDGNTWNSLE